VLSEIDLPQEAVGGLDGGDPGQRQLLGQAILQGAEGTLAAAPGLRRIGRNMANAELLERPAHLGQLGLRHFAASLGGVEVVAAAVGVELHEQAVPFDHLEQPAKAAQRAFFLDQKGRVDLARGVVHGHDQIELMIQRRQPTMG
jgi:hypothetical protein